jgi:hypothetical protein
VLAKPELGGLAVSYKGCVEDVFAVALDYNGSSPAVEVYL